jgi:hypothetical protein
MTSYSPYRDGRTGHVDNWTPDKPQEVEFELYDYKGNRAAWLEKALVEADFSRIAGELVEAAREDGPD